MTCFLWPSYVYTYFPANKTIRPSIQTFYPFIQIGFLRYAPWESLGAGSCVEKIRTGVGLKRFQGKWLRQNTVDRRCGVNHRIHVWYAISLHLVILVDFYGTVNIIEYTVPYMNPMGYVWQICGMKHKWPKSPTFFCVQKLPGKSKREWCSQLVYVLQGSMGMAGSMRSNAAARGRKSKIPPKVTWSMDKEPWFEDVPPNLFFEKKLMFHCLELVYRRVEQTKLKGSIQKFSSRPYILQSTIPTLQVDHPNPAGWSSSCR